MTIQLSTVLNAPSERIWEEVNRTALHAYVTRPLLTFEPVDPPTLPERWEAREYRVRMKLFGAVPLGWQIVKVERPATEGASQQPASHQADSEGRLTSRRPFAVVYTWA